MGPELGRHRSPEGQRGQEEGLPGPEVTGLPARQVSSASSYLQDAVGRPSGVWDEMPQMPT